MAQESRLAVTIDSRGAKRNADDLAGSLERMERAGDAAAASADGVSSSLDDQRKELSQLLGQINPTVAALGRLDDMQEKLAKFKKAGVVESDTFVEYTQRINTMRDALGESAASMNKAGMSAKAYQAALRGVPAQFTDIAVSLQGGQAPLTVLLQQGGQLKDMFGGIGPAAKALAGYVLGLVNPFTVAAAAAGALGVAYYRGSEQSDALRNSLIMTGNFSKASEAQLISLAESADQVTGTFGQAAGALSQLTDAGVNTTGNLKLITTTAVEMQRVTGKAVEDTVAEFIKLGKDPVAGIVELDEKYRFLTASVYAQIKALADQGNAVGAADLAERTYAEAMGQRTSKIRENLGSIERGWLNIKDATNEVIDAFDSIGRKSVESEESAIKRLQQELAYRNSLLNTGYEDDTTKSRISEIEQELAKRRDILAVNQRTLEEEEKRRRIQEEGRKGLQDLDTAYKSSMTQTQRLNKELSDLDKAKAKAVAAGAFNAAAEAKYAQSRKNIEKEIADIKEREAKKNAPKNVNRGVAEAENTFSRLYAQYDPASQAARALTKEQQQLDLAFKKGKISQEEYGKALAQASTNYAAAIKGAQGLTRAEQYRAQMERKLATERMEYTARADAVGMGQKDAARMQERLQLEQETNNRILQLQTELANAQGEKQRQDLQAQIDLEREYLGKRIAAQREGWAQLDQAQSSWSAGARGAFQDYLDSARDVAGQSRSFFTNAFSSMEDAVANFAISGKLSFSDFTKSILADMARIATRQAATGIFASIAGSAIGSWFGGGANGLASGSAGEVSSRLGASAAGYSPKFGFATGGYTGDGGKFEPKGVVHGGEFVVRKEVVSQPGMRDHLDRLNKKGYASGGMVGSSQQSPAASATYNFPISVQVDSGGQAAANVQSDQSPEQTGRSIQAATQAEVEKAIAAGLRQGGSIWRAINRR
ncbi:phage tail tape measure protein [Pseudomonas guariconensis]|uniref:phage tail tape measure protein n=1 Tax=Pseudomonas guariconensis TaxID=1288410 RepID=UPI002F3E7397